AARRRKARRRTPRQTSAPTGGRPMSRPRQSTVRMRACFLVIAFVLSLFAARLFQIQGVDANAYAAMALAEGSDTIPLHAERGQIVDRDGDVLATSVEAVALTADPTKTAKDATKIASILVSEL